MEEKAKRGVQGERLKFQIWSEKGQKTRLFQFVQNRCEQGARILTYLLWQLNFVSPSISNALSRFSPSITIQQLLKPNLYSIRQKKKHQKSPWSVPLPLQTFLHVINQIYNGYINPSIFKLFGFIHILHVTYYRLQIFYWIFWRYPLSNIKIHWCWYIIILLKIF